MMPAGAAPRLAPLEIHVWELDLSEPPGTAAGEALAAPEEERARRFVFERDGQRYRRARAALRGVLSLYLGLPAKRVALRDGPDGKPFVDGAPGIGFNLSHSGDIGIVAVGRMPHVGVDVEARHVRPGMRDVAALAFTAAEKEALAAIPDDALADPFLTCWTRKEACLKALGTGLAADPRSVEVGVEPGRRRLAHADATIASYLEVETIRRDARCVASLAAVGGFARHVMLRWRG